MHQRLEAIVANLVGAEIDGLRRHNCAGQMPAELIARHIASTFVLVLNWWLECEPALTPAQVDARFRSLVQPSLVTV